MIYTTVSHVIQDIWKFSDTCKSLDSVGLFVTLFSNAGFGSFSCRR